MCYHNNNRTLVRHLKWNDTATPVLLGGFAGAGGLLLNYSQWSDREPCDGYVFIASNFRWRLHFYSNNAFLLSSSCCCSLRESQLVYPGVIKTQTKNMDVRLNVSRLLLYKLSRGMFSSHSALVKIHR